MKRLLIAFLSVFSIVLFADDTNKLQDIINKVVKNGEKCVKLEGWYHLEKPIVLTTKHSQLTIDGQGKTTLCGGKKITLWQKVGKLWKAKVDTKEVHSIYVNGRRAEVAKTKIAHIHSECQLDIFGSVYVRTKDVKTLVGVSKAELQSAYIDEFDVWRNWHCPIIDLLPTSDSEIMRLVYKSSNRGYNFYHNDNAPRFQICNVRGELDEAGEFFFDAEKSEVLYYPREDEDINSVEAYYPVAEKILYVHGDSLENPAKNITIKGIEFFCGKSQMGVGNGQQAGIDNASFIRLENLKNSSFENNKVHGTNLYGLRCSWGVQNLKISENEFYDIGCGAVRIGETSSKIKPNQETIGVQFCNNLIYGYGRFIESAVGLLVLVASDVEVKNNTIFDGYYSAISSGWTWGYQPTLTKNNKYIDNRIFKIGYGYLNDMGGIYTLGLHEGSVISGNEISQVFTHKVAGGAIYNDEGSAGFLIENNYVHDVDDDCYYQHYGKNNIVRNNIFAYGKYSQLALLRRGKKYPDQLVFERNIVVYKSSERLFRKDKNPIERLNGKFDNNIYWSESGDVKFCDMTLQQWQEKYGQDKNSYIVNPQLKDGVLGNDHYKKIGFKPFSTKDAGVIGKMKDRLNEILRNYKYPQIVRLAGSPDWTRPYEMYLLNKKLGSTPDCNVGSAKKGRDVRIQADKTGRFVRFTDMTLKTAHYMPFIRIPKISLAKEDIGVLTCDIRVNKTSTFFVELRGDTGYAGAIAEIENGCLIQNKKKIELPFDKWLSLKISMKLGADKRYQVELCDGQNILADFTREYDAKPMSSLLEINVAQTSNTQDYYFDIRNLKFRGVKGVKKSK